MEDRVYYIYDTIQGGNLMLEEIKNLKQKLYKELDTKESNKEEILEISRELDKLIVKYSNGKILDARERIYEGL